MLYQSSTESTKVFQCHFGVVNNMRGTVHAVDLTP